MKTLNRWIVAVLTAPLAACNTLLTEPIRTTEADISEPAAHACVVTVHVDHSSGIAFVDQEPAHTKRCKKPEITIQVSGPWQFKGTGVAVKAGYTGNMPTCAADPAASKKKITCRFAMTAPTPPDRFPYEVTIEKNGGGGTAITVDPMMIND